VKRRFPFRWPVRFGLNPVLVKELRQAVRSRFVAAALLLFLLVQVGGTGIMLVVRNLAGIENYSALFEAGRMMFHMLFAVLTAACLLFIPAYTGVRLAAERRQDNLDLLYITAIRPPAVIRGKQFAGAVIALLLFGASAPFMSFTYLLRGIDLPSIFVALAAGFLVIQVMILAAIFVVCIPASRVFKSLLGVAMLISIFWAITLLNVWAAHVVETGVGSTLRSGDFWKAAASSLGLGGTAAGFLYVLSVAAISPSSANRALPVRAYATGAWLCWGVVAGILSARQGDLDVMGGWLVFGLVLAGAGLFIGVGENETISARVRRAIPRRAIWRAPAFVFWSGPAGGVVWAALLAASTIGFYHLWGSSLRARTGYGSSQPDETVMIVVALFLHLFGYAMTAVFLWRWLLKNRLPPSSRGVTAMLLVAAGAILPVALALAFNKFSITSPSLDRWYYLGNVAAVFEKSCRGKHIIAAGVLAVVMTGLNLPWFGRQIRAFKPLREK